MTKTVLISINTSWNITNFRAGLIRALKTQGYRIITAAPQDAHTERLAAMVDQHINLPMQNAGTSPTSDMALFKRYVRLMRAVQPDVVLTYTIKPNIYGVFAAAMCGIPAIANVSGLGTTFIRKNWLTNLVKQLYRRAFKHAACVFFQNPVDRQLFIDMNLVAAEKTALLPGSGIDLVYFHPSYNASQPVQTLRFALIARMLWDKGISEYVAAARIVKAAYPDVVFNLVGARDVVNKTAIPNATIDAWVTEGVVTYLGETDDIRSVMAQQDCIVLPSYREGMSRVLLEAAAMGKPLIASDVPGCAQVIDAGENGLLCTVRDAESLAASMLRFLELTHEQRAAMGAASRAKAEAEFDETQVFEAYVSKIAEVTR